MRLTSNLYVNVSNGIISNNEQHFCPRSFLRMYNGEVLICVDDIRNTPGFDFSNLNTLYYIIYSIYVFYQNMFIKYSQNSIY